MALASAGLMTPFPEFFARDHPRLLNHGSPARYPDNRQPFAQRGHQLRRTRPGPVRPLRQLSGSPVPANRDRRCLRCAPKGQAATRCPRNRPPARAKCRAVPESASVLAHRVPYESPTAPPESPYPGGLLIKTPTRCQPIAQTLRPDIRPVLLDVVQTRRPVGFAVNHPPSSGNIGERRPQAVLLLVVDQHKKTAIIVVKRIGAHSSPGVLSI